MTTGLRNLQAWFVTGSQHLYGEAVLARVDEDARTIAACLDEDLPVQVVAKPVVTTPEGIAQILPPARREGTLSFLHRYDVLLGEYLRGQLLVATFVGIATAIGFWIVGFPNAILLGVVAGIFNIVPYLGLIVSLVPAALIALLTPPLWLSALKVAGVSPGAVGVPVIIPRVLFKVRPGGRALAE